MRDVGVDDEDSVSLDETSEMDARLPLAEDGWPVGKGPRVALIRLPRISNFTDFRPLFLSGLFRARWVDQASQLEGADLIVLPGTKSTMGDLEALRQRGMVAAIRETHAAGARVLGVCGGYQMLGERIVDPEGVESSFAEVEGLALLPVTTTFAGEKVTEPVRVEGAGGWLGPETAVDGYEIHMGCTEGTAEPLFYVLPLGKRDGGRRPEGSVSPDGRVAGTYVHGLFDHFSTVAGLARLLGVDEKRITAAAPALESQLQAKQDAYDRLAAVLREHLDLDFVRGLLELDPERE
jgi:adenosylcobyric acid synthase